MRKWPILIMVLVVLVVIAGAAVYWVPRYLRLAITGAGYSAELACACLFVSGRDIQSCQTDFDPAARRISLEIGKDEVTASVPLIVRRTARFEPGFGCTIVD